MDSERFLDDYTQGYLDALNDFAWSKDGTQLVGCGYYSHELARENFLKLRAEKLIADGNESGAAKCLAMIERR